jgi:hypothetical protein
MRKLNPRKLLLSKWTAVKPVNKEKHFLVRGLVKPVSEELPVEQFELEAGFARRRAVVAGLEVSPFNIGCSLTKSY